MGTAIGSASVSGVVRIGRVIFRIRIEKAESTERVCAVHVMGRAKKADAATEEALPPQWWHHYIGEGECT